MEDKHMRGRMHELLEHHSHSVAGMHESIKMHDHHMNLMHMGNKKFEVPTARMLAKELKE